MEKFFELILDFHRNAHRDMTAIGSCRPQQLNVFVDLDNALCAFQFVYLDQQSDRIYIDTEENSQDFLTFHKSYQKMEKAMVDDGQKTDFPDVIFMMQHNFIEYASIAGYDRNVLFAIVYFPLDKKANPLKIPAELLLQLEDKMWRN